MTAPASDAHERIRRMLVGCDFSDGADAALAWARVIADAHGASLLIVHAIPAAPRTTIALELQNAVEQRLEELRQSLTAAGIDVETAFEVGRPWEVLNSAAGTSGADLIVLGARGQTPAPRLQLGSTVDRVLRTARAPVLTVRALGTKLRGPVGKILVPVDFSTNSERATRCAVAFLRAFPEPRTLILMHACHSPLEYAVGQLTGLVVGDVTEVERPSDIGPRLEQLAEPLRAEGFTVETVASEGYAASAIEATAIDRNVDMIAMGTHGRTGLARKLLGSTAERTLHHAPCAVLTIPPLVDQTPSSSADAASRPLQRT